MINDIKKIAEALQDNEIAILKSFSKKHQQIAELKGMPRNEFLRAGMWLENKGLIKTEKVKTRLVTLDANGKRYVKTKLPEIKLLALLRQKDMHLVDLENYFTKDEIRFIVGYLKQRGYLRLHSGILSITESGKQLKLTLEFKFMLKLAKAGELAVARLEPEEQHALQELSKRKQLIKAVDRTSIKFQITDLGKQVILNLPLGQRVGVVKSDLIKTGSWKNINFRRYDVSAPVPRVYAGKKQPYLQFLDDVRAKLIKLGYIEMIGPLIETEFWNFDALFQPQNHPARTWTDTYSLKDPKYGKLPHNRIVQAVKNAHEHGVAGSKGWGYKWNQEVAKQLMPRAHSTSLSARYLAKGVKVPGKYFSIARVYRPDVLDSTHLIEFNQLEGIVIDPTLNFKNLLGLLKQFAIEFAGAEKVKFIPDYYPFTEPSVQMNVKHPELGWIELGGAGIFRLELTHPLGEQNPVLAWGIGIDRLAMCKLGISDIRYLFSPNLDWIRKEKVIF